MTPGRSVLRRLRWPGLAVVCAAAVGWWAVAGDDATPGDRVPLAPAPVPAAGAAPAVRSVSTLAGDGSARYAKPVVAADRDGRVVVVAMSLSGGATSDLARWPSVDGGRTWAAPALFDRDPAGCDFLGDPWVRTDHRGRFHLAHLATSLKARNVWPLLYRRSVDGGATWKTARVGEGVDRPVLGLSPDGTRAVIVGMGLDAAAEPLTAAEVLSPDRAVGLAASDRVHVAAVLVSRDRGRSWGAIPGPPGVRHAVPFAAVADDAGRVAAAWLVNDGKGSRGVAGSTADGGRTWSLFEFAAGVQPDRPHPFSGGRYPVLAADGVGRLHAVFVGPGGTAVFARVSRDWRAWSDPVPLSAAGVAGVRLPAVDAAGDVVHAAWLEEAQGRHQARYRASRDGGETWSAPLTLSRPGGFKVTSDDDQTAVSDDRRGTAHVVWAAAPEAAGAGGAVWHAAVEWR